MENFDKMIDTVIRRYGFENEKTIGFCSLVEEYQKSKKQYKLNEIMLVYSEIIK